MLRIGIVGTGGMANVHAEAFAKMTGVKLAACCDVLPDRVAEFARKHKIPNVYTEMKEMLRKEKLDGIANVTPDTHHEAIGISVLKKGIAILSEKPLAADLDGARRMARHAEKSKTIHMVNFSYRNSCAVQAAAEFIAQGGIGAVIHVEASYLQSWISSKIWGDWRTNPAWLWRMSTRHGSQGVLGDVGCHIYDLVSFLCGDIEEIHCRLKTFKKDVPRQRVGEYVLDANESFVSSVSFANGAIGTIHASRWATGHANSLRVRVYGSKGAVEVDLDKSYNEYRAVNGPNADKGVWETVVCKPTPSNYERFIKAVRSGKNGVPDFHTGLMVQAYLHASFESDQKGRPVKVKV